MRARHSRMNACATDVIPETEPREHSVWRAPGLCVKHMSMRDTSKTGAFSYQGAGQGGRQHPSSFGSDDGTVRTPSLCSP